VQQNTIREMTTDLQVLLFDVGGVLVELGGVADMLGWLEQRIDTEQLWYRWLHSPAVRAFETGRCDAECFASGVLTEFALTLDAAAFLDSFRRWPTRLFPGTLQLLERIPPRYVRALLSNSNELHWSRIIDEMGLGAAVSHQFASHLTGRIKPDHDAFVHVLTTLDRPAGSVLFLDDNRVNVEAARSLGMHGRVVQGMEQVTATLQEFGVLS
jgi:glucose-1-phosphatase